MTIDDILDAYDAGTFSRELTAVLLDGLVADRTREQERCEFARAALTGMLATGVRRASFAESARECFAYADEMLAAKAVPPATP